MDQKRVKDLQKSNPSYTKVQEVLDEMILSKMDYLDGDESKKAKSLVKEIRLCNDQLKNQLREYLDYPEEETTVNAHSLKCNSRWSLSAGILTVLTGVVISLPAMLDLLNGAAYGQTVDQILPDSMTANALQTIIGSSISALGLFSACGAMRFLNLFSQQDSESKIQDRNPLESQRSKICDEEEKSPDLEEPAYHRVPDDQGFFAQARPNGNKKVRFQLSDNQGLSSARPNGHKAGYMTMSRSDG